jgi:sterol desaturase/sphingolipid hydroxylase (fatty acid hydroxylase superfamily)
VSLPADPTVIAIPFFLAAILVERWVLTRPGGSDGRVGYERRDTIASIGMGVGSLLFAGSLQLAAFGVATLLWPHRLFDLGSGLGAVVVAVFAWDFMYYWQHRAEHEVRFLWAAHVNHHSSQRYNLSTALRQPWTAWTTLVFFPPLALLGVSPHLIVVAGGLNLIYQFWIHTEVVGRLPRPFEQGLNTASHHRVHHGSNPRYLDRNYGSILIVWDRLFGSFEGEDPAEPVIYGLTKNIDSFNLGTIALHEYVAVWRDVRAASTWRDRVGHLVKGPGWTPSPALADSPTAG